MKVGDRVKVTASPDRFEGQVGTIVGAVGLVAENGWWVNFTGRVAIDSITRLPLPGVPYADDEIELVADE